MKRLWDWIKNGILRLLDPVANWLVRHEVHPNTLTVIGTLCTVAAGVIYATGHISAAGWFLGLTALFDVLDGTVARRSNKSSRFGAFLDSSLDRVADGAVMGGLAVFYATSVVHQSVVMFVVCITGLVGVLLTSYTRARAEALGLEMKGIGLLERPERIVLLSAPQAFFGLALNGWVLASIIVLLTVTAWFTVVQRVTHVYRVTRADYGPASPAREPAPDIAPDRAPWSGRRRSVRPLLKGE